MPLFSHPHPLTPRPNPYAARLAASQAPKIGRIGRWYLPAMALICLGFGISNYLQSRPDKDQQLTPQQLKLLDSYGERGNLHDVQRAMELYEVQ